MAKDDILPGQQVPVPVTGQGVEPAYYDQQVINGLPTGFMESMAARLGLGAMDWAGTNAYNAYKDHQRLKQAEAEGEAKLSANELNALYPYMEEPFTEPMPKSVAQTIANRTLDRMELEKAIMNGPQDILSRGVRFSAGLVEGMGDPLFLGSTIATAPLFAKLGANLPVLGSVLAKENPGYFEQFLQDAYHTGSSMVLPEGVNAYQAHQEHRTYTAGDYFGGIAMNAFGFAGLHAGARFLLPKAASFLRFTGEGEGERVAHETAIAQLLSDQKVNVDHVIANMVRETDGQGPGIEGRNLPPYEYRPITRAEDVVGKDFYYGDPRGSSDLRSSKLQPIEEDYGHGIYMTDNPYVANGTVTRALSDHDGSLFKLGIHGGQLNLIDLEKRLNHGPVRDIIQPYLERAWGERRANIMLDTLSGKQILENIKIAMQKGKLPALVGDAAGSEMGHPKIPGEGPLNASTMDEINWKLMDAGFDGYRHEGGHFMGEETAPHNVVMMFDHGFTNDASGRVFDKGVYAPDRSITPKPTLQEYQANAQQQTAPENDQLHDPKASEAFEQIKKEPPKALEKEDLDEMTTQAKEAANAAFEQAKAVMGEDFKDSELESLMKEFEDLKEMEAQGRMEETATKAATFCMGQDL